MFSPNWKFDPLAVMVTVGRVVSCGATTVTKTVSGALSSVPSLAINWNSKTSFAPLKANVGAVNVGCVAVVLLSETVVPEIWDQT